MTTISAAAPGPSTRKRRPARGGSRSAASSLGLGVALLWFSILVLIPLAMVVATAGADGWSGFWRVVSNSQTFSAVQMTVIQALLV
ncbi:MAG: molybdate ABC transporter permease subunit, partial [Nocardioidaceae bacterium]